MSDIIEKKDTQNPYLDLFMLSFAMFIPFVNIILLIYWKLRKNNDKFKKGFVIFLASTLTLLTACSALFSLSEASVKDLFAGRVGIIFTVMPENSTKNSSSGHGYLNIGDNLYEVAPKNDMLIHYADNSVMMYTEDGAVSVMYEDSGIKTGNVTQHELEEFLVIEMPEGADDVYNYQEKYHTHAEKVGINGKDGYVTYTQGTTKYIKEDGTEIDGYYTEIFALQDIGAENYLVIRIAERNGEAPSDLIMEYALTVEGPVGR